MPIHMRYLIYHCYNAVVSDAGQSRIAATHAVEFRVRDARWRAGPCTRTHLRPRTRRQWGLLQDPANIAQYHWSVVTTDDVLDTTFNCIAGVDQTGAPYSASATPGTKIGDMFVMSNMVTQKERELDIRPVWIL